MQLQSVTTYTALGQWFDHIADGLAVVESGGLLKVVVRAPAGTALPLLALVALAAQPAMAQTAPARGGTLSTYEAGYANGRAMVAQGAPIRLWMDASSAKQTRAQVIRLLWPPWTLAPCATSASAVRATNKNNKLRDGAGAFVMRSIRGLD